MAKQNILIVDSDPESVKVLEVSLKKAGYSVTTARDGAGALEVLAFSSPDLVISDTRMRGMDGFELCTRLKENDEWVKIPFIFLTADKSIENKIRGLELGVDDYLNKPIFIREILVRVNLAIQRRQKERLERRGNKSKFSGNLQDMGLVDLLQTIDLGNKTGVLHIVRMNEDGTLFFKDGQVIDAVTQTRTGADAVYRMLVWSDGTFEIEFTHVEREARIRLSTQGLLMEGMRRLDEWGRLQEQLPPLTAVFDVDERVLADRLGEIPDEVNAVLRHFDSRATLMEVVDNGDLGDLEALTLISKLYFEGLIQEISPRRSSVEPALDPDALLPEPSESWEHSRPPRPIPSREARDSIGPHLSTAADFAGLPPDIPTENPASPIPSVPNGAATVLGMPSLSDPSESADAEVSETEEESDSAENETETTRASDEDEVERDADVPPVRETADLGTGGGASAASEEASTGAESGDEAPKRSRKETLQISSRDVPNADKIAAALDAEAPPPDAASEEETEEEEPAYFDGASYRASLGPRSSYEPVPRLPKSERSSDRKAQGSEPEAVSQTELSGDPFSGPLDDWPEDPPEVPRNLVPAIVISAVVLVGLGIGGYVFMTNDDSPPAKTANMQSQEEDALVPIRPLVAGGAGGAGAKLTPAPSADTEQGGSGTASTDSSEEPSADTAPVETAAVQSADSKASAGSSPAASAATEAAAPVGNETASASKPVAAASGMTPEKETAFRAVMDRVKKVGRRKKIDLYREALAINPNGDEALAGLAILLLESKQTRPEALSLVNRAIAVNPDNAAAWIAKGYLLQLDDNPEGAKAAYRKCAACSGPDEYTRECRRLAR